MWVLASGREKVDERVQSSLRKRPVAVRGLHPQKGIGINELKI